MAREVLKEVLPIMILMTTVGGLLLVVASYCTWCVSHLWLKKKVRDGLVNDIGDFADRRGVVVRRTEVTPRLCYPPKYSKHGTASAESKNLAHAHHIMWCIVVRRF
jgi:hypothetical protein